MRKEIRIIKLLFSLDINRVVATIDDDIVAIKIELKNNFSFPSLLYTVIQKIDDNSIENVNLIINDIILNITNIPNPIL